MIDLSDARILFLNPVSVIGGAERVLLTAIAGLRREVPTAVIRLIAPSDGPLIEAAAALGTETEVVAMPASLSRLGDSQLRSFQHWHHRALWVGRCGLAMPLACRYLTRLRRSISRFRPSLVHSNGVKTHLLSRLAVPRGVPVVWHLHDFYSLRPAAARLLRRASGRIRGGIAISRAVAADAARVLPRISVRVVPNAVNLARFCPGPGADLDKLAGLPPARAGIVRIGLVATYARWKGHLTFLDAVRILAVKAPHLPIRACIVGGPIYQTAAQFSATELRTAAKDRGITIGFVPFQPDPASVYRGLDIVVHASTLAEPFGLTIAEAMACGRPVVVSAAGGAAELFAEGQDALGFPPGDASAMASAIRRLAEDAGLRTRLGEAARATAVARFDDSCYGQSLINAYTSF